MKIKQEEIKPLYFTVTRNKNAVDITGCSFFLGVKKEKEDPEYAFYKNNSSFEITDEEEGVVYCMLEKSDTTSLEEGSYVGELVITFPSGYEEKSDDFEIYIKESVTV
ncbi:MAG: hypothetical protein ACOC5T_03950 [Elusimicrobiota bacterium]